MERALSFFISVWWYLGCRTTSFDSLSQISGNVMVPLSGYMLYVQYNSLILSLSVGALV